MFVIYEINMLSNILILYFTFIAAFPENTLFNIIYLILFTRLHIQ